MGAVGQVPWHCLGVVGWAWTLWEGVTGPSLAPHPGNASRWMKLRRCVLFLIACRLGDLAFCSPRLPAHGYRNAIE